jgi:hypothetical protein
VKKLLRHPLSVSQLVNVHLWRRDFSRGCAKNATYPHRKPAELSAAYPQRQKARISRYSNDLLRTNAQARAFQLRGRFAVYQLARALRWRRFRHQAAWLQGGPARGSRLFILGAGERVGQADPMKPFSQSAKSSRNSRDLPSASFNSGVRSCWPSS